MRAASQRLRQQQLLQQQQQHYGFWVPLLARFAALFGFGVLYGVLISHLHENRTIAPVRVEGLDHGSWEYLAFWGAAGIALGSLLPVVDAWLDRGSEEEGDGRRVLKRMGVAREGRRGSAEDMGWIRVIRSVGAFVGIAFAIVRFIPPSP